MHCVGLWPVDLLEILHVGYNFYIKQMLNSMTYEFRLIMDHGCYHLVARCYFNHTDVKPTISLTSCDVTLP